MEPTQSIEYLGFSLNSTLMTVELTEQKAMKIYDLCKQFHNKGKKFTIRQVSSLIGSLTSSFPGVEFGQLHYRHIESGKNHALKENFGNFEAKMKLSDYSLTDLEWWIQNINTAQRKSFMVTQWSSSLLMHQRQAGVPKLKMVKAPEVYGQKMSPQ